MRKRAAVADLRATLCGFGFVTWKAGPTARTGLRPQEAVSDRKPLFAQVIEKQRDRPHRTH